MMGGSGGIRGIPKSDGICVTATLLSTATPYHTHTTLYYTTYLIVLQTP